MTWAQELKDFVSGFESGSKIAARWDSGSKKSTKDAEAAAEAARVEAAGAGGEAAYANRASTATPGDTSGTDEAVGDATGGAPTVENAASSPYIAKMTQRESGGDPNAKAKTSSATGLHQFTSGTWDAVRRQNPDLGLTAGGRTDPAQSTRAVARFTQKNAEQLDTAGFKPTQANKYLAHFMGSGGAKDFLSALQNDPSMTAAGLFPKAARANPSLFYKDGKALSVGDAYNRITKGFSQRTAALPTGDAVEEDEEKLSLYGATGGYVDPDDPDYEEYVRERELDEGEVDPVDVQDYAAEEGVTAPEAETTGTDTLVGTPPSRREPVTPTRTAVPARTAPAAPAKPPSGKAAPRTAVPATPPTASPAPGQQDSTTSDKAGSGAETASMLFPQGQLLNRGTLAEATKAGLDYIQSMFTSGAGIPEQAQDRAKKVGAFARNEGVPTPTEVGDVDKIVDPKGEIDPKLKSIARLNGIYEYYMKKGDQDKAAKTAAAMLMYTRQTVMQGGAHIQALLEKGNREAAAKMATKISNEVPNGQQIELKAMPEGDFAYKVFDDDTGRLTGGGRLAVNEVMRLATGMQDGSSWFEQTAGIAGRAPSRSGAGRPAAKPRTTGAERAAAAATAAEQAAEGQRRAQLGGKAAELGVPGVAAPVAPVAPATGVPATITGAPAAEPRTTALPTGVTGAAAPQDLTPATSGAAAAGLPLPPANAQGGAPVAPGTYATPTGPARLLPEEAQAPLAESPMEQDVSRISTDAERRQKISQLGRGAATDTVLRAADKAYTAATTRKGVRTSDSQKSRDELAEEIETGFKLAVYGDKELPEGQTAIPKNRRPVFNAIAAKLVKANEGLVGEDAGRILGSMVKNGFKLNSDGTIQATEEGSPRLIVDGKTVRMLDDIRGQKTPSVAGVNTRLTPRQYQIPPAAQGTGKPRPASPADIAAAKALTEPAARPVVGGRGSYPQGTRERHTADISPEVLGRALGSLGGAEPDMPELERAREEELYRPAANARAWAAGPEADRAREYEREQSALRQRLYGGRAANVSGSDVEASLERDRERDVYAPAAARRAWAVGPEYERGREAEREAARRDQARYQEQESWKAPPESVRGEDQSITAAITDSVSRYINQALGRDDARNGHEVARGYVEDRRNRVRRRAIDTAVGRPDYDELEGERRSALNLGPEDRDVDRERGRRRDEYSKR